MRIFKFQPFSKKQRQILNWWTESSPVNGKNGIIADGAIRSGKTLCMSLSFVMWAMSTFNGHNFGMCGKTIGSFRRNVLAVLVTVLVTRGYSYEYRRGDNLLIIRRGSVQNNFYIFGGKDESSQDLVQGITLAGVFFDEVALMPQSFVNQATARCSVAGSKWWFNCNPESPAHWFKKGWIDRDKEQGLIYLHFTMNDNLSLSEAIKERYRNQYTGVFYDRYIRGLWVIAEGIIYDMFDPKKHVVKMDDIAGILTEKTYISCDYGTQNATVFKRWTKGTDGIWYSCGEYYYSGRDKGKQKTDDEYVADLQKFIGSTPVKSVIVDPSAASFIAAVGRKGIPVMKARNEVLDGIREVGECLNTGKIKYTDDCTHTIEEFGAYAWDEKAAERGEDRPLKTSDHCMDADRYFVHTILKVGRAKVKNKRRLIAE